MTRRMIDQDRDPFLWLEEVESQEALAWVHERNARAESELQDAGFAPLERELREILDSPDRIPAVVKRGPHLYNFWTDADHPQGIWRRTTLESYRTEAPEWEVLLDLDELSAREGVTWVWHGATVLRPEDDHAADPGPWRRALVSLSRGGSDADVTREFDLVIREFVPEEAGGFYKPEGKGNLSWIDADTVYASTDQFSPQSDEPAVTTSGYPRFALRWRRGTPLEQAAPVISVEEDEMVAVADCDSTPGHVRHTAVRMLGFYDSETYLIEFGQVGVDGARHGSGAPVEPAAARLRRVEVPTDVRVGFHRDLILLMPRTDFILSGISYPGGSLVVGDVDTFMEGDHSSLRTLFAPDVSTSLQGVTVTRHVILLTVMSDVVEHLEAHWRDEHDAGPWRSRRVFGGITGSLAVSAVDPRQEDTVWITANDFLSPTTKHLGDLSGLLDESPGEEDSELIKQAPERFDASGLAAVQRFARSPDGTQVPYFLIGPHTAVTGEDEGHAPLGEAAREPLPTVLYGYGGFEISQTPGYLSLTGKAWLERGGAFAVANIRGGGEYGPQWHQAALRDGRHRAYEDFAAVARDLVGTGVTVREKLACRGGSNGGLLTGNMLTQYPGLFGAVVIQVPLLDMKRYAGLLAGASWRAEYGDPETEDWEFLQTFSPYHLLKHDAEYPTVLLTTSTRDDRVHPGHARKMTAALEEIGADVRYWENTEGGHGGAANPAQQARMNALIHRYLWQQLGR